MRGADSLFSGPVLRWGLGSETTAHRFEGTGLFAIEVGSGRVYALAWDHQLPEASAPVWVPLS
jgi:hypothetical protein